MDMFQFVIALSWVLFAISALILAAYLIFSGRLKRLHNDSAMDKIGLEVTETLGIKEMNADEILAFESFLFRDLQNIDRGIRLAYTVLFIEKGLLAAQFEKNALQIELTEKGQQVHKTIISECEKRLMVTSETEIKWRTGEKKSLRTMEEKLVSRMDIR